MKPSTKISLFFLAAIIAVCACALQSDRLSGPYLGQTPPGRTPQLFAPGIVSTGMDDRDIAISSDGKEIVYSVLEKPLYTLVRLRQINGVWQDHEIMPFSGHYNDYEPQFSPDGQRLYFCSERPAAPNDTLPDADIWMVEKQGDGWGEPINLGAPVNTALNEFYPSVSADGTLYFTSHTMKIMCARREGDAWQAPVQLSDSINTGAAYNACVSPDGRFLIFTSHSWGYQAGRGDLFVSFKNAKGAWGRAKHLDYSINSYGIDMCPSLTADGKYLFFSSNRTVEEPHPAAVTSYAELKAMSLKPQNKKMDIYWVDAAVLQESP